MCRIHQFPETKQNDQVSTSETGLNCAPPGPSTSLKWLSSIIVSGLIGQPRLMPVVGGPGG